MIPNKGIANRYLKNRTESGFIPALYNGSANNGFMPYVAAAIVPKIYPLAFTFMSVENLTAKIRKERLRNFGFILYYISAGLLWKVCLENRAFAGGIAELSKLYR